MLSVFNRKYRQITDVTDTNYDVTIQNKLWCHRPNQNKLWPRASLTHSKIEIVNRKISPRTETLPHRGQKLTFAKIGNPKSKILLASFSMKNTWGKPCFPYFKSRKSTPVCEYCNLNSTRVFDWICTSQISSKSSNTNCKYGFVSEFWGLHKIKSFLFCKTFWLVALVFAWKKTTFWNILTWILSLISFCLQFCGFQKRARISRSKLHFWIYSSIFWIPRKLRHFFVDCFETRKKPAKIQNERFLQGYTGPSLFTIGWDRKAS